MPPTVINICAQRQLIISTSVTEDEYTLHPGILTRHPTQLHTVKRLNAGYPHVSQGALATVCDPELHHGLCSSTCS